MPYLTNLIKTLEAEPDQDRVVGHGFLYPHSYRGHYHDLAFQDARNVSIAEMSAVARSALGATFTGWKGGDFEMHDYSTVWLVVQEGECGETLGPRLLRFMLATPPYPMENEKAATP